MPTEKTSCPGLDGYVAKVLEDLYEPIVLPSDDKRIEWLHAGIHQFEGSLDQAQAYQTTYRKRFEKAYDKLANDRPSVFSSDDKKSAAQLGKKLEQKLGKNNPLANALADVHMGALLSAESPEGFSQADFNRAVAKALKILAEQLAEKN